MKLYCDACKETVKDCGTIMKCDFCDQDECQTCRENCKEDYS